MFSFSLFLTIFSNNNITTTIKGEEAWFCKPCALSRQCARCQNFVPGKGARVRFADGSTALHCRPCAERLAQPAQVAPLAQSQPAPAKAPSKAPTKAPSKTPINAPAKASAKAPTPVPAVTVTKVEKRCEICDRRGGAGARVTLASGKQEWLCRPCALRPRTAMVDQALVKSSQQRCPSSLKMRPNRAIQAEALAPPESRRSRSKSPIKARTAVAPPAEIAERRASQHYASMHDFQGLRAKGGNSKKCASHADSNCEQPWARSSALVRDLQR